MLAAVLRAPLSFFESTPTGGLFMSVWKHVVLTHGAGRILNMFSRDVYVLDQVLPGVIQGTYIGCNSLFRSDLGGE
jgi:ATP-binding cassette subfamily C (CFTR/MRP) protein 1